VGFPLGFCRFKILQPSRPIYGLQIQLRVTGTRRLFGHGGPRSPQAPSLGKVSSSYSDMAIYVRDSKGQAHSKILFANLFRSICRIGQLGQLGQCLPFTQFPEGCNGGQLLRSRPGSPGFPGVDRLC